MRFVFVLTLLFSLSAQAQNMSAFKNNNTYVSAIHTGTATQSGQSTLVDPASTRNTILESLFSSSDKPFINDGFSWPPLPRFWGMEGQSKYLDAKAGIAVSGPFAFDLNTNYKYEITTTFHYLGSLKMVNRTSDVPLNSILPEDFEKIFIKDYTLYEEYFNVSDQNPIVGMCQYELALYHGVSVSGGISFVLQGIVGGGLINFARLSVYSKMFNLKPRGSYDEHSSRWYKEVECMERFNKYAKPFVDEAFAFKAVAFNAHYHPHNTCAPAKPIPNKTDKDCTDWQESFWSKKIKKSTVGRCQMHENGESHCVLKAKENMRCPMYYSDGLDSFEFAKKYILNKQRPPSRPVTPKNQGPYSLATSGVKEYPCDAGLVCTMDTNTTATCKKLKTSAQ